VNTVKNQMVPPCVEWWHETDNQATIPYGYCSSMALASLLVWPPHCVNARWNRRQEDLNSLPLGELEETTGTPSYYVDEDYPTGSEIQKPLLEWSNWRGSESSTLTTDDVWPALRTATVVHARNDDEWQRHSLLVSRHTLKYIRRSEWHDDGQRTAEKYQHFYHCGPTWLQVNRSEIATRPRICAGYRVHDTKHSTTGLARPCKQLSS